MSSHPAPQGAAAAAVGRAHRELLLLGNPPEGVVGVAAAVVCGVFPKAEGVTSPTSQLGKGRGGVSQGGSPVFFPIPGIPSRQRPP